MQCQFAVEMSEALISDTQLVTLKHPSPQKNNNKKTGNVYKFKAFN